MDAKYEESPRPVLLAYPEGHRMGGVTKVDIANVKTGMIRVAMSLFSTHTEEDCRFRF